MAVDAGGGRLVVRHDDRAGDELAADVYRTAQRAGIVLVELSPVRLSSRTATWPSSTPM